MFGVSGEHLLVLGIILLIFGPRRLPEVGVRLGKAVRNFRDAYGGIQEPSFRRLDEALKAGSAAATAKPETTTQAEPAPNAAAIKDAAPIEAKPANPA